MGEESQRKTRRYALRQAAGLYIALLICAAVSGCGYSYATSRLSNDYSTVAVPAFKNKSFEPNLQIRVTNLLIRELLADGRFRVVDAASSADLVLTGAITGIEARAITLDSNDNISEYKIAILANASLVDTRTGKAIWKNNRLRSADFYQTRGGRTREEALDEASENLVETIIFEALDSYW
jgi:outer membrane lipopolysaccharide assembly protein LptE/RlpB